MARKCKEESERTYNALLDAATQLFIRQGVSKTTLNEIACAAGMTRGAVYWHFDNKDAVIIALWERNAKGVLQGYLDTMTHLDPVNPGAHFRRIIKDLVLAAANDLNFSQALRIIMHCVEFSDNETELQRYLFAKRNEISVTMEKALAALAKQGALRTSLEVDVACHAITSLMHGLVHAHLEPGMDKVKLTKHGEEMLDLLLDGIIIDQ